MPTGKPTKKKPCVICGEMFLPEKPSSRICSRTHYATCPVCGKQFVWNTTRKVEPCSKQCRKELTRRNNLEKYGVEHPMQSKQVQENHKKSLKKHYGVEHPLQSEAIKTKAIQTNREKFGSDWGLSSDEVKTKARQTMTEKYGAPTTLESKELADKVKRTTVEKYGVEHPAQNADVKDKIKKTNLERYGHENAMQNPEIAKRSVETRIDKYGSYWSDDIYNKAKETWIKNLGVDNPSKSQKVIDKMTETFINKYGVKRAIQVPEFKQKMIDTMISRYGQPYYCLTDEFKSYESFRISKINKTISEKLSQENISHELEYRLETKWYDIYIPDQKTVIEVNPTYTHNSIGNHWNKDGLPSDYHLEKSKIAESHGLRCIHIFDWENPDTIIDMLKPKKRLYARNMTVYKLRNDVTDEFLSKYHLQGSCRGQLLCLGLTLDDELYQVMTFGKSRYDKNHYVELLRLCTKPGYTVVGGASKLFSYATSEFGLYDIISYCDISKFRGDVYEKIGMKLLRTTPPQEIWSKGDQKITANLLRQRGYDQLFNTSYGKGTSNDLLMLEHGWLPVYDCGQKVYFYE